MPVEVLHTHSQWSPLCSNCLRMRAGIKLGSNPISDSSEPAVTIPWITFVQCVRSTRINEHKAEFQSTERKEYRSSQNRNRIKARISWKTWLMEKNCMAWVRVLTVGWTLHLLQGIDEVRGPINCSLKTPLCWHSPHTQSSDCLSMPLCPTVSSLSCPFLCPEHKTWQKVGMN